MQPSPAVRRIYIGVASAFLIIGLAVIFWYQRTFQVPMVSSETDRMVKRLALIAETADPLRDLYLSTRRAELFQRELTDLQGIARDTKTLEYAYEMLNAGDTGVAVSVLNGLLDSPHTSGDLKFRRNVRSLLANSYFRLGEQQNCLDNTNADYCILSVDSFGVHTRRLGAREAVEEYLVLLNEDPSDAESRWLLNIAYMALGMYPDDVPARWLISPETFTSAYDPGRFHNVSLELGMESQSGAGGVVVDDLDGDSDLDIMVSAMGLTEQLRYYRNDGNGHFSDQTVKAGLTGIVGGLNLIHADYDNDGDNDVLVLRGAWHLPGAGKHPNSLLRNRGDGSFDDVTESSNLLSFHPTQSATFADFDGDGWLDLFIGNESRGKDVHPCELYRNNGDGTFTDLADHVGLKDCRFTKGVAAGDFDNDGRPDLYISRMGRHNLLLNNRVEGHAASDWHFDDRTVAAGVGSPRRSFPTWVWDYDNDGWLDIFVSSYGATRTRKFDRHTYPYHKEVYKDYGDDDNLLSGSEKQKNSYQDEEGNEHPVPRLYRNEGNGTFSDQTSGSGLAQVFFTMGCNFGDLDNDGWQDFYLGTGAPDFRALMPNRLFRNNAAHNFQDVTTAAGVGHLQKGHGIVFADIDNDGDQDIFAQLGGAYESDRFTNAVFANPGNGNAWVTLKLEGRQANRSAIGARIRTTVMTPGGERDIYAVVSTGSSFGSSSLQQEIGLADATHILAVEITWPGSRRVQRFHRLPIRHIWRLVEGDPEAVEINLPVFDIATLRQSSPNTDNEPMSAD